jgi:hypothetical protein
MKHFVPKKERKEITEALLLLDFHYIANAKKSNNNE